MASLLACLWTQSANAQIRDDLDMAHQAIGEDVDAAIAKSERHGETDTKERRDLINATAAWYDCAKSYIEIDHQHHAKLEHDQALIAVLSCAADRAKIQTLARAYSLVNGNPKAAESKALSIEYDLREILATRLISYMQWSDPDSAQK